jgi:hypothetical protein
MAETLITRADFPREHVVTLTTDRKEDDLQPTRDNILAQLIQLRNIVPSTGLIVFYFSGHGASLGNKAYLLPSTTKNIRDPDLLDATGLPLSVIVDYLAKTHVKQVIILLDACRNGAEAVKGSKSEVLTQAYMDAVKPDRFNSEIEAFAVCYSTSLGGVAYINPSRKMGYFTVALVDGLKGAAVSPGDPLRRVTLASLDDYLGRVVPSMLAQDQGKNSVQKPYCTIERYRATALVLAVGTEANPGAASSVDLTSAATKGPSDRGVPISVSVTAEGLFLHRNGLGNYLHQYIAATPEMRKQLRLSIIEPEIAVRLREGPTKRIDDPQLPSNEYSYLRSSLDTYGDGLGAINRTVNELISQGITLLTAPDASSIARQPMSQGRGGTRILTGSDALEYIRALGDGALIGREVDHAIETAVQQYFTVAMGSALQTLLFANRTEAAETFRDTLPTWIWKRLEWKPELLRAYHESDSSTVDESDMIEIEFGGGKSSSFRAYVPRVDLPRPVLAHLTERPYSGEPLLGAEKYFSPRWWYRHIVWQTLARYGNNPRFTFAWTPSSYPMFGLP